MLHRLYNLIISTAEKLLPAAGHFDDKMNKFVKGRADIFKVLEKNFQPGNETIWFHAASLGEYEQAVPVITEVKKQFPRYKILLTFFSPSGYEVKKGSAFADVVTYLPLDTRANAEKFLDLAQPDLVLFIKYEFWPNFLKELKRRKIKTLLISGSFREDQIFFKPYGKWMQNYLRAFDHFFLQNKKSQELLNSAGFSNTTVSGDTRFDRVSAQLEQDNDLHFVAQFKSGNTCVVCGSTWPEDETLLINYINQASEKIKFIIAPHIIKSEKINSLKEKLRKKTFLFSEKTGKNLADYKVLILDTIGLLTKVYSYADIAYVGGAVGDTGLHNVLEPAAFGLPVITGNKIDKFPEAKNLERRNGLFTVSSRNELKEVLDKLIKNTSFRKKCGSSSAEFIEENKGATTAVMNYLRLHLKQSSDLS